MRYDSLEDMPPKLRELAMKQLQKQGTQGSGNQTKAVPQGRADAMAGEKKGKRKYNNLPTERLLPNGEVIKFGSKKEAAYFDNLKAMEASGVVRNIKLQYQYLIKPAYTDGETGERFRAISYLADFVFERLEDGAWKEVVVDTKGGGRKGTKTKDFIIKRKLLAEMGIIIEIA